MTKSIQTRVLFSLAACSFLLAACGHDYNTDDYKRQLLQQSLATMAQADGDYTSLATSKLDSSTLGAFDINIKTSTSSTTPGDQSDPTAAPNLEVTVTYTGPNNTSATIVFDGGSYHPDIGGSFLADYSLQRTINNVSAPAETIEISGTIANGHFQGSIYDKNAPNYGVTFDGVVNGPTTQALLKNERLPVSATQKIAIQQSYVGTTKFSDGTTEPVVLVLNKPTSSNPSLDAFYDLLVPNQPIAANLNYGNGAFITFNSAGLDLRTGKLAGTTFMSPDSDQSSQPSSGGSTSPGDSSMVGSTDSVTLNCTEQNNMKTFSCQLTTNDSPGVVGTANNLQLTNSDEQAPPDNPDRRAMIRRTYRGTMNVFQNGMQVGTNEVIYLTAVYEAQDRTQELYDLLFPDAEKALQVSWVEESDPDIGTTFSNAKWDFNSATLDQTQELIVESGSTAVASTGTISIDCTNFYFYMKAHPFSCHFTNTNGAVDATMSFTGRPIKEP